MTVDHVLQNQKISGIEIRIEDEFQPIHVNCGATNAYTDALGNVWSADEYFKDERDLRWQTNPMTCMKETDDDELYLTERFATRQLMYEIPVPTGIYQVILHFAEIYSYFTGNGLDGKRVFNVFLEDTLAYETLDVYKEVGPNTAMKLAQPASVNDGKLLIRLEPEKNANGSFRYGQYPKISAIEILELKEVYKWNNYGWNRLTLAVMNTLDDPWSLVFDNAIDAWSAGAPGSSSRPLKLMQVEVPPDPNCVTVPGRITVCNGDYGDAKWVVLNTVTLQDGFIKNSVARMNDYILPESFDEGPAELCNVS